MAETVYEGGRFGTGPNGGLRDQLGPTPAAGLPTQLAERYPAQQGFSILDALPPLPSNVAHGLADTVADGQRLVVTADAPTGDGVITPHPAESHSALSQSDIVKQAEREYGPRVDRLIEAPYQFEKIIDPLRAALTGQVEQDILDDAVPQMLSQIRALRASEFMQKYLAARPGLIVEVGKLATEILQEIQDDSLPKREGITDESTLRYAELADDIQALLLVYREVRETNEMFPLLDEEAEEDDRKFALAAGEYLQADSDATIDDAQYDFAYYDATLQAIQNLSRNNDTLTSTQPSSLLTHTPYSFSYPFVNMPEHPGSGSYGGDAGARALQELSPDERVTGTAQPARQDTEGVSDTVFELAEQWEREELDRETDVAHEWDDTHGKDGDDDLGDMPPHQIPMAAIRPRHDDSPVDAMRIFLFETNEEQFAAITAEAAAQVAATIPAIEQPTASAVQVEPTLPHPQRVDTVTRVHAKHLDSIEPNAQIFVLDHPKAAIPLLETANSLARVLRSSQEKRLDRDGEIRADYIQTVRDAANLLEQLDQIYGLPQRAKEILHREIELQYPISSRAGRYELGVRAAIRVIAATRAALDEAALPDHERSTLAARLVPNTPFYRSLQQSTEEKALFALSDAERDIQITQSDLLAALDAQPLSRHIWH